jgi:4-amino-4-deoxy-L-arabinose transferase-like glycosyltransferase
VVETTALDSNPTKSWPARLAPALLVLACGWLIVLLRGPLPLDETRYAEVFRELLSGDKFVLTLNGEGYSHKTPLLFWFAWLAHSLGLSLGASLLVWPAVFSSATVLLVGRIGERLGIRGADWIQACMLMPVIFSGVVLFDALLAVFIWLFLWARSEERSRLAALASIPMMMAKGPAALVFAIPYGLALSKRDSQPRGWSSNLMVQLLPGLVALGGWAYFAIWQAGSTAAEGGQYANNLLWNQTAGRVVNSFAHARPLYWYLPVILLATLPFTGQLLTPLRHLRSRARPRLRRLVIASLVIFAAWSLISGKQPHYLLPMLPALALLFAVDLEERPELLRRAHIAGATFCLILVAALLAVRFGWPTDPIESYNERAATLRASGLWNGLLFGGCALAAGVALTSLTRKPRLIPFSLMLVLGLHGILAPIHSGLGTLLLFKNLPTEPYNSELRGRPLATIGNQQAGMYNLIFEARHVARLPTNDAAAVRVWCQENPTGAFFVEEKNLAVLTGLPVEALVRDRLRGKMDWAMLGDPAASFDPDSIRESGQE